VNRDIITNSDARAFALRPRRGTSSTETAPQADDYWSQLAKIIPVEVTGAYLTIYGIVASAYSSSTAALRVALTLLFLAGLCASYLYAQRVLHIQRKAQLYLTCAAYAVWVFSTVGIFSTFFWYRPWMAAVAVVSFGLTVKIAQSGPLA